MIGVFRVAVGQVVSTDENYECEVRLVHVASTPIVKRVKIATTYLGTEEGVGVGLVAPPNKGDFVLVGQSMAKPDDWFIVAKYFSEDHPAPAFRKFDWKIVSEKGAKIHLNDSFNEDDDGVATGHISFLGDRVLIAVGTDFLEFGLTDDDTKWPSGAVKPSTDEFLIVHDTGTKIRIASDGTIDIDAAGNEINFNEGSKGVAREDDEIQTQTMQLIGNIGIPIVHDPHQGRITSSSSTVKSG